VSADLNFSCNARFRSNAIWTFEGSMMMIWAELLNLDYILACIQIPNVSNFEIWLRNCGRWGLYSFLMRKKR
jgi:hypothetical protein